MQSVAELLHWCGVVLVYSVVNGRTDDSASQCGGGDVANDNAGEAGAARRGRLGVLVHDSDGGATAAVAADRSGTSAAPGSEPLVGTDAQLDVERRVVDTARAQRLVERVVSVRASAADVAADSDQLDGAQLDAVFTASAVDRAFASRDALRRLLRRVRARLAPRGYFIGVCVEGGALWTIAQKEFESRQHRYRAERQRQQAQPQPQHDGAAQRGHGGSTPLPSSSPTPAPEPTSWLTQKTAAGLHFEFRPAEWWRSRRAQSTRYNRNGVASADVLDDGAGRPDDGFGVPYRLRLTPTLTPTAAPLREAYCVNFSCLIETARSEDLHFVDATNVRDFWDVLRKHFAHCDVVPPPRFSSGGGGEAVADGSRLPASTQEDAAYLSTFVFVAGAGAESELDGARNTADSSSV